MAVVFSGRQGHDFALEISRAYGNRMQSWDPDNREINLTIKDLSLSPYGYL